MFIYKACRARIAPLCFVITSHISFFPLAINDNISSCNPQCTQAPKMAENLSEAVRVTNIALSDEGFP